MRIRRKRTAAALAAGLFCTAFLSGCVTAEAPESGGGKEITVAVNSETGTLDPAGSIALTYLAYSYTCAHGCKSGTDCRAELSEGKSRCRRL